MKLSKSELRLVRRGADLIAKNTDHCIATNGGGITYACEAVGFGELARKLKAFYDPPPARNHGDQDCWAGLPYSGGHNKRSQLTRELMLELFAHLKGEL